jgi:hypothetical protein
MNDETKIAGLKKVKNWRKLKAELQNSPTQGKWQQAFDDFLFRRIETRYFEPVRAISKIRKRQGKGFSIVAVYCSLIEFFEAVKKGYEYRQDRNYYNRLGQLVRGSRNPNANGLTQPLKNEEVFVNFLTENAPFNVEFTTQDSIIFYKDVRCSILHQAETTGNWIIKDGINKDKTEKTEIITRSATSSEIHLNWIPLGRAFESYLLTYRTQLINDRQSV